MPIIVREVVSMIFQGIMRFIFNLPSAAPGGDNRLNRGGGQGMIRDKTIGVHDFAGPFHGGGQVHPIDVEGVIPRSERDVASPLIGGFAETLAPTNQPISAFRNLISIPLVLS